MGELGDTLAIFKGFRLANPEHAKKLLWPAVQAAQFELDLQRLVTAGVVSAASVSELLAELGAYASAVETFQPLNVNNAIADHHAHYLAFWRGVGSKLPHWSNFASNALLYVPSSAAAERAFSVLKSCYSDKQASSLEETVETTCMLQFNHRTAN